MLILRVFFGQLKHSKAWERVMEAANVLHFLSVLPHSRENLGISNALLFDYFIIHKT